MLDRRRGARVAGLRRPRSHAVPWESVAAAVRPPLRIRKTAELNACEQWRAWTCCERIARPATGGCALTARCCRARWDRSLVTASARRSRAGARTPCRTSLRVPTPFFVNDHRPVAWYRRHMPSARAEVREGANRTAVALATGWFA